MKLVPLEPNFSLDLADVFEMKRLTFGWWRFRGASLELPGLGEDAKALVVLVRLIPDGRLVEDMRKVSVVDE